MVPRPGAGGVGCGSSLLGKGQVRASVLPSGWHSRCRQSSAGTWRARALSGSRRRVLELRGVISFRVTRTGYRQPFLRSDAELIDRGTRRLARAGRHRTVMTSAPFRARHHPQFDRGTLPQTLSPFQVGYEHVSDSAAFASRPEIAPHVNAFWRVRTFTIWPTMPWARRSVRDFPTAFARPPAVRNHVRRGDVVALSPRCITGCLISERGEHVSCARTQSYRAGADVRSGELRSPTER